MQYNQGSCWQGVGGDTNATAFGLNRDNEESAKSQTADPEMSAETEGVEMASLNESVLV